MTSALVPVPVEAGEALPTDPQAVVEAFLAALAEPNLQVAGELLDEDVRYVNVGCPTIRGRKRTIRVLAGLDRPGFGFEVYLHAISADGATVLTERTDVLLFGPLRLQFWVAGRFDVRDGRITLWRDAFDYVDILRSTVRAVAALAVPGLRPAPPRTADTAPGRH